MKRGGCNVRPDAPARHEPRGHRLRAGQAGPLGRDMGAIMNNIFWIIGVIVVILIVLSFFGLR
jgi:hypothetical protein